MNKSTVKRVLVFVIVALLSIGPLVLGFVAGVVSMVAVIVWHALRLGFERGFEMLREGNHATRN